MAPRNLHHLLWMIVAVEAFALGYLIGNSQGTPGRSQLSVSSTNPVEVRARDIDVPGETNTANVIRESGGFALNSKAASTGNDKPLPTLIERAAQAMLTGSDLRRQHNTRFGRLESYSTSFTKAANGIFLTFTDSTLRTGRGI